MTPNFISNLGFAISKSNVKSRKIDRSSLKIYKMVIAGFKLPNKLKRV